MSDTVESALAWCLQAVADKRATVEECVQRFPEHREQLRRLLPLAMQLGESATVQPSLRFRRTARARLLAKLPERPATIAPRPRSLAQPASLWDQLFRRPKTAWIAIAALLLATLGGGAATAYAADDAMPGDVLYSLDTAVEQLRLGLTRNPNSRAELALSIADERIAEVGQLTGRPGSEEYIAEALNGYGESIAAAAAALAEAAASGHDQERTAALQELLNAAVSVHAEVLTELQGQVPGPAQEAIRQALQAAARAVSEPKQIVPGAAPAGPDVGPPEELPIGPPEGSGDGDQIDDAGTRPEVAELMAAVDQQLAEVQALSAAGRCQEIGPAASGFGEQMRIASEAFAELVRQDPELAGEQAEQFEAEMQARREELVAVLEQLSQECLDQVWEAASAELQDELQSLFETLPFESPEDFMESFFSGEDAPGIPPYAPTGNPEG